MGTLRVFSFDGGVQSTSVMVLQVAGRIPPYDAFVFANVGEDSENPDTLAYIKEHTLPYAERHGLALIEVSKGNLLERVMGPTKSVHVPGHVRNAQGRVRRLHRNCTDDYKVRAIDDWIKAGSVSAATVGLGISLDEYERVKDTRWHDDYAGRKLGFWKQREYPLIDLRLKRADCERIIADAGLPVPPKSSCFYCPFRTSSEWIELKKQQPDLFDRAVEIDERIRAKPSSVQGRVSLHRSGFPLAQAVGDQVSMSDYENDACEDGYCMT